MRSQQGAARRTGPLAHRLRSDGGGWIVAALFWLVFYQNFPDNLNGSTGGFSDGQLVTPNILDRFIKIAMLLISGYWIYSRWRLAKALAGFLNPGLLGFLAISWLSVFWSIAPAQTALRCISLDAIVLTCFAFGIVGWHPRRFQQLALPPIMLILMASVLLGMLSPESVKEIGTDISLKDAWHGLTHGKNEFGMLSSLGVILCANRLFSSAGGRAWALAGGILASACLVLSRSSTSLFATLLALLAMWLLLGPSIVKRHTSLLAVAVTAVLLLYEMVIQGLIPGVNVLLAPVTSLTGKDTTFSARTMIWQVIKDHIRLSPLFGSGYGAYWIGPLPESPSAVFLTFMSVYPTESHNGYLEVVNDLGFLGLGVLLVLIVFGVRQSLRLMRTDRSQAALFLAILFQQMVMNMSESDWFARSDTFAIVLLSSIALSRSLLDARHQEQQRRAGEAAPAAAASRPVLGSVSARR